MLELVTPGHIWSLLVTLVTAGHTCSHWSHMVTPGQNWSHLDTHLVISGHNWSHLVTIGHTWSHWSHLVTSGHIGHIWSHCKLQTIWGQRGRLMILYPHHTNGPKNLLGVEVRTKPQYCPHYYRSSTPTKNGVEGHCPFVPKIRTSVLKDSTGSSTPKPNHHVIYHMLTLRLRRR